MLQLVRGLFSKLYDLTDKENCNFIIANLQCNCSVSISQCICSANWLSISLFTCLLLRTGKSVKNQKINKL